MTFKNSKSIVGILTFLSLTFFYINPITVLAETTKQNKDYSQKQLSKHHAHRQAKLFKKLDMSPEQISKIEAHQMQTQPQRLKLYSEIKNLEQALYENISSNPNNIDSNTVKDIKMQLDTQRAKLSQLDLDAKIFFNQILTADQREELQSIKAKKTSRRSKHKKRNKVD